MKERRPVVPSVRAIIRDGEGRVLILKRAATAHAEGAWCLPGGKVDYGDSVEQSVRREVLEETKLTCTSTRFLFYQDSPPLEPGGMHCINLYFTCDTSGEVALNSESSEAAWIGRDELEHYELVFRNEEGLQRFWEKR